jgi:hypothetical protein
MKEYDEHQRKRHNRTKKAKKAKQDVHSTPVDSTVTNIRVFPETQYNEPLDWGTDSTQNDQSSDEDSVSNEIAATAGISRLSLTPAPSRSSHAPSNRSSKSKGKQRECYDFEQCI